MKVAWRVGLVLLLGLLAASPACAAEPATHSLLFTLKGAFEEPHIPVPPPEGEFEDACGVAVDGAGDIYVSDYYHHAIDVYSPSRTYLTQIADREGPCNLAVDSEGNLYVNNWRRNVVRFSPAEFPPEESTAYAEANTVDSPAALGSRSTGVFLDPATGALFVDDRTYVAVYEAEELSLPEPEPARIIGLGVLGAGYGIAVSDFGATAGDVYVPDADTGALEVFGPGGALIGELDGAGTPGRGFADLTDSAVAVDQTDGHVFVADNSEAGFEFPSAAVDEFNPLGDYRGQLPQALVDAEPTALAVDALGNVLATSGNGEDAAVYGFGPTFAGRGLAVTKSGEGEGTVTSEPAGINCGTACAAEYNDGEEVTLTAVADPGSAFAGWSGCDRSAGTRCTVALGVARAVDAEFAAAPASSVPEPVETAVPSAPAGASEKAIPGPSLSRHRALRRCTRSRQRHRRCQRKHAGKAGK